jgi:hypothetical protein
MRVRLPMTCSLATLLSPPDGGPTRRDIGKIDRSYGVHGRHQCAGDCQAIIADKEKSPLWTAGGGEKVKAADPPHETLTV